MIIPYEALQALFKCGDKLPAPSRVREILRANKIPFGQDMKGRPFTTQTAIDYAIGVPTKQPDMTEAIQEFDA